ncbi:GDSL-type esterase/lipase family protein [Clostridium sp. HBUAS56017]|uniref:rhamnogalacturonan acetylesterase n=1 Tax=Clostridium sp. HBUAS56017 TaxID=2571128 RepID=UPI001A9B4C67|nr:GDSL-type esterase/lipase family protein [Clostridium sp. HBUAS56017]
MKKTYLSKNSIVLIISIFMLLSGAYNTSAVTEDKRNALGYADYKYDFGGDENKDYISIMPKDVNGVSKVVRRENSKESALVGDFSFSQKLDNGEYNVTVIGPKKHLEVKAEGDTMYKGSGSENKKYLEVTHKVLVKDGKLDLDFNGEVSIVEVSKLLKFNLGTENKLDDYASASSTTKYSKELGYGFNNIEQIRDVKSSGDGVCSNAVEFLNSGVTSKNTFNIDVPSGRYKIKVIAGDIFRMSVAAEGYFAVMNMTGNNAVSEFEIPVTDGQLNILGTAGKEGTSFSISAIEVSKISDDLEPNHTIFVGGDSTVTAYYPLVAPMVPKTQGGWGQMLEKYLPDNFRVHNYATGGQFAKGFLISGQFDAIEDYIKPGDYYLVAFGINDTNYSNEEEYKASTIEMLRRVKEKGAIPILVTGQGRASDFDENNVHHRENRWFKTITMEIAKAEDVQFIDLNNMSSAYFTEIGQENTNALYWVHSDGKLDTLHPNRTGAGQLARLIVEELMDKNVDGLENSKILPYGTSNDLILKSDRAKITRNKNKGTITASVNVQNLRSLDTKVTVSLKLCNKNTSEVILEEKKEFVLPAFDTSKPTDRSNLKVMSKVSDANLEAKLLVDDGVSIIDCQGNVNNKYNNPMDISNQMFISRVN